MKNSLTQVSSLVLEQQRSAFIQDEVPQILKKMALLGLSPEEVFK